MIVQCDQCKARFRIADEKVTPRGVRVRCTKCSHTFVVRREASSKPPEAAEDTAPEDATAPAETPGAEAPAPPAAPPAGGAPDLDLDLDRDLGPPPAPPPSLTPAPGAVAGAAPAGAAAEENPSVADLFSDLDLDGIDLGAGVIDSEAPGGGTPPLPEGAPAPDGTAAAAPGAAPAGRRGRDPFGLGDVGTDFSLGDPAASADVEAVAAGSGADLGAGSDPVGEAAAPDAGFDLGAGADFDLGAGADFDLDGGADPGLGGGADFDPGGGADPGLGAGADFDLGAGADFDLGAGADFDLSGGADPGLGAGADLEHDAVATAAPAAEVPTPNDADLDSAFDQLQGAFEAAGDGTPAAPGGESPGGFGLDGGGWDIGGQMQLDGSPDPDVAPAAGADSDDADDDAELELAGEGPDAFGGGADGDPFGSGLDTAGASEDPFGSGLETAASDDDPFGSGLETAGAEEDPFGGAEDDPFGGSPPGQAGDDADPFGGDAFSLGDAGGSGFELGDAGDAGFDLGGPPGVGDQGAVAVRGDEDDPFASLDQDGGLDDDLGVPPPPPAPPASTSAPDPSSAALGRVKLVRAAEEAAAESGKGAPKAVPPKGPSRWPAVVTNVLFGVGVLAAALAAFVAHRTEGAFDATLFSPDRIRRAVASPAVTGIGLEGLNNGAYETRGGTVLYVRGEAVNRDAAAAPPGAVTVRLRVREQVLTARGVVGALPTPEDLWKVDGPEAAAALMERLAAEAPERLGPGERAPFFALFPVPPVDPTGAAYEVEHLAPAAGAEEASGG